jgi:hypothetical protein
VLRHRIARAGPPRQHPLQQPAELLLLRVLDEAVRVRGEDERQVGAHQQRPHHRDPEDRVDGAGHPLLRPGVRGEIVQRGPEGQMHQPVDGVLQQIPLAGEVVRDQPAGHAGALGDVAEGGLAVSPLSDQLHGRLHDALARTCSHRLVDCCAPW